MTRFGDQQGHYDDERPADKSCTMSERQPRAHPAARNVGHGHHQAQLPPDMTLAGKQNDGRQVREHVNQLGPG